MEKISPIWSLRNHPTTGILYRFLGKEDVMWQVAGKYLTRTTLLKAEVVQLGHPNFPHYLEEPN